MVLAFLTPSLSASLHSPLPVLVDQLGDRLVCLVHQLAPRIEEVRDARVEGLPAQVFKKKSYCTKAKQALRL